jgi:small Trp-rich protein
LTWISLRPGFPEVDAMGFVLLGLLLAGLKLLGLSPVASWPWWLVLAPFGLAALWWALADALGYTQRANMRRQDTRVAKRREAQLAAMGLRQDPAAGKGKPPRP